VDGRSEEYRRSGEGDRGGRGTKTAVAP
jgi:hypothetical protein